MSEIKPGIYKHFKGGRAKVYGVGVHTETKEEFVVYEHPDEKGEINLWIRPKEMFLEKVEVNGIQVPRFEFIESV